MAGAVLESRVTAIGAAAPDFFAAGIVILFGPQVPPELREVSVLHEPGRVMRDVRPGDSLQLAAATYRITAVGAVANRNLRELGHAVFKFNGLAEAELPGDICVEAGPVPVPAIGDLIRIW